GTGGIVKLRSVYNTHVSGYNALPGYVVVRSRDLALASQDLPETHASLKQPQGIRPQYPVRDMVQGFRRVEKTGDRHIAQRMKLGKGQILIAKPGKPLSQQTNGFRVQSLLRRTTSVDFTQRQVHLQRRVIGADS